MYAVLYRQPTHSFCPFSSEIFRWINWNSFVITCNGNFLFVDLEWAIQLVSQYAIPANNIIYYYYYNHDKMLVHTFIWWRLEPLAKLQHSTVVRLKFVECISAPFFHEITQLLRGHGEPFHLVLRRHHVEPLLQQTTHILYVHCKHCWQN